VSAARLAPGRLRRGLGLSVLAAALALTLLVVLAGVAVAAPDPGSPLGGGSTPGTGTTLSPATCANPQTTAQANQCAQQAGQQAGQAAAGALNQTLNSWDTGGTDKAALEAYHVYYDDGSGNLSTAGGIAGGLTGGLACGANPACIAAGVVGGNALGSKVKTPGSVIDMIEGWLTDTLFTGAKWSSWVGLQVLDWSFDPTIKDWIDNTLLAPVMKVSDAVNVKLLGPLNVMGFFLFLTLIYAGWHTFRGRSAVGIGEFGLSLLIYAMAIVALNNPVQGFKDAVDGVTNISGQVMSVALSNGLNVDGIAGKSRCPALQTTNAGPNFNTIQCVLRVEFVDVPFDMLNFGKVITPADACWGPRQTLLKKAPGAGDANGAQSALGGNCGKLLQTKPSMDRFFSTFLYLLAILVMVGLLIVYSAMGIMALLTGIFLLMGLWPMFALGLLPGGARRSFWRWVTAFAATIASVIAMAAFLAVLIWGSDEALNTTGSLPIVLRFLVMDIVGIMMLKLRRTMLHKVTTAVRNTGDKMPGSKGTLAAAGAGAAGGMALAGAGGGSINWGGTPGRPNPGGGGKFSPWIHPASYQSPRLAAPHELGHQLEQKFWHSKGARPVVRAKHGVKTLYPVRHPIKTITSPYQAVRHPIKSTKKPFKPLPDQKPNDYADHNGGRGYPNNHHPWIPE